jgi:hypothetical protein
MANYLLCVAAGDIGELALKVAPAGKPLRHFFSAVAVASCSSTWQ